MGILSATVGGLTSWLTLHQHVGYIVLFLGSYFETVVGPAFFIPGEIFFLAGSILGGAKILNIWIVIAVLYTGGILGDSTSYFIGKKMGASVFKEGRLILNPKNHERGEKFFQRHGYKSIFLARLLGPLSWITPFLSGTYRIPYGTFLSFEIPGVVVGIGEFILVGYFFGTNYKVILPLVERYILFVIAVIVLFFLGRWYFQKHKKEPIIEA
jgi:membrane-associated protein